MRRWWHELAPRERRTVTLGLVALAVMAFYFLVWLPPRQALPALEARVDEQRQDLQWMRDHRSLVMALREDGGNEAAPAEQRALYALADDSARGAGLDQGVERIEPSGDRRVRIVLSGVGFNTLVRWLGTLREDHGVATESAAIRSAEEPGRVDARLVLTREAS